MSTIALTPYLEQRARWPAEGRHIMAQYDDASLVVYQAYRPEIADWAVERQRFGGPWSFSRMSWIKPNFLWMMFRCGWASKPGQERVLAIRLERNGFNAILAEAVHSSFVPECYPDRATWQARVKGSDVRLQWDPDHTPSGAKETRRAIQLGMRGKILAKFATTWIVSIEDVTELVHTQHERMQQEGLAALETPSERPYPVVDPEVSKHLGIDVPD